MSFLQQSIETRINDLNEQLHRERQTLKKIAYKIEDRGAQLGAESPLMVPNGIESTLDWIEDSARKARASVAKIQALTAHRDSLSELLEAVAIGGSDRRCVVKPSPWRYLIDGEPVSLDELLEANPGDVDEIREACDRAAANGSATIGGGASAEFVIEYRPAGATS